MALNKITNQKGFEMHENTLIQTFTLHAHTIQSFRDLPF